MKNQLKHFFINFTLCFFVFVTNAKLENPIKYDHQPNTFEQLVETYAPQTFIDIFNNLHTVEPGKLYRSAQLSPQDLELYINMYGIQTIINLRGINSHTEWWQDENKVTKKMNVLFFNIPMSHSTITTLEHFKQLIAIYKNAPRPILIHCRGGADRTGEAAAIWILYQMLQEIDESKNFLVINDLIETSLNQFSIRYRHIRCLHPQKLLFVKCFGECYLKLHILTNANNKNYQELSPPEQKILLESLHDSIEDPSFLTYAHEALNIPEIDDPEWFQNDKIFGYLQEAIA